MLPGLSNVLRRDKEKQRPSIASLEPISASQNTGYFSSTVLRRDDSGGSTSSNPLLQATHTPQSPTRKPPPQQHPIPMQQAAPSSSSSSSTRVPKHHHMLPEEHRAKEREREKLARAQLGNAHTQQMMANRQLQQNMSPARQDQLGESGATTRVSRILVL
jgi:hypothetical protein